jgi:hypothetical protein
MVLPARISLALAAFIFLSTTGMDQTVVDQVHRLEKEKRVFQHAESH